MDRRTKLLVIAALHQVMIRISICLVVFKHYMYLKHNDPSRKRKRVNCYSMIDKIPAQVLRMQKLVHLSDKDCIANFRMDRNAFFRLSHILQDVGGLQDEKYISVEEQTAMFLYVLAHDTKNRYVRICFNRSGHTVSKYFNRTLNTLIRIHRVFLPEPQPVAEDCTDDTWKWFKGCLGALDGTRIKVRVPATEKSKYRSRNGEICTNVLGVCDRDMKFVYILSGWEGSATDNQVLRDAISRPKGLNIPTGHYYLCDNAYTNGDGLLTSYRGKGYHLGELGEEEPGPCDFQEFFNIKHYKARSIIEKAFEYLKKRWDVLQGNTFYTIKMQNRIIMACALLHNFIRTEMAADPLDTQFSENFQMTKPDFENVDTSKPSEIWDNWRDNVARDIYNSCLGN